MKEIKRVLKSVVDYESKLKSLGKSKVKKVASKSDAEKVNVVKGSL